MAWIVDYRDQRGRRHIKTFAQRRNADAFHSKVAVDVSTGIHTPDRDSITVAAAGELWVRDRDAAGLERTTLVNYRNYLDRHLVPAIGTAKLSQLTVPAARAFEDRLRAKHSPTLVRAIIGALGAIIDDAQERGLVAQNVIRTLRSGRLRRRGQDGRMERRHKGKLKIGIDIPAPDEMRAIVGKLDSGAGRFRPLLLTAIFTGLRSCELRGLRWSDIDLKRGALHVRQRADGLNKIGPPKSESGERAVPLPPMVVNVLREWRLVCPKGELDLVFPGPRGCVQTRFVIVDQGFNPAQIAAGVVTEDGKAKYKGLHALRHFYASWCINRRVDGGLELPLKVVQARLGHASIQMTADTYGHLFPRSDDGAELAAAERAFLAG